MRILLASAVAVAPLMAATGAMAEVVISSARTTPITTSNATGSTADNIRIASGGAMNVSTGPIVTIDSNNTLNLEVGGTIGGTNTASGTTGVLVDTGAGGITSGITIAGSVSVLDGAPEPTDTDSDGDLDGPFAEGSDRYGLRVTGDGPFAGDITIASSGSLTVEGNNSYGFSLETDMVGRLQSLGTIRVTGNNTTAVRLAGGVDGNVVFAGVIAARGENARGLDITGDVSGRLTVHADISATGFRYLTPSSQEFIDKLDADDLLPGGPAVSIGADIAGGVVFDQPPPEPDEDDTTTNPDRDGDGIPDVSEVRANIASFGEGAALQIGSMDRTVTLGVAGTGEEAYGLINRGSIASQGVYVGYDSNAVVIGLEGGQAVTIAGGFRNDNVISAVAGEADATAIRLNSGATVDRILNGTAGVITATGYSEETGQVSGLRIESGAQISSLVNNGVIRAASEGGAATVRGIVDYSGNLASITNNYSLIATLAPDDEGAMTGTAAAIDVQANTTGVTFIQEGLQETPTETSPDTDGDGVLDAREPSVVGAILFGSGADVADIRNGAVLGDISFGAGADQLRISGDAVVVGRIMDSDGQLDIDIARGVLDARQTTATQASSLNVGAQSDLIFTLDPTLSDTSGFAVSGTATFADGAGIGARFNNLLDEATRFTVVSAGTLNYGNVDAGSLETNSPYLYVVTAEANTALGELYINARQRTTQEMGLISVETSAFDAIYSALGRDEGVRNAFLAQLDREGFINLYEQMLPEHSGGPLLSLASGVDAVTRALVGRNASAAPGETSAWVQEINFYADKSKTDTYGFRSEGFGIAGGVEHGTDFGAFGVTAAFTSSDLEDPESEAEEVLSASLLELGLYWRAQGQHWTTWARAAGGYATFDSTRRLVGAGLNLRNESDWSGFTVTAAGGVSYERTFGRFSVRPEVYAEYFSLSEEAHTETGGGNGFDLSIDDRDGHLFAATAAVNISMGLGDDSWVRPELRVGWRQNISVDPGETVARFVSGGPDFRLTPGTVEGGGPILGLRVNIGNELGMLVVSADAEMIDNYVRYMLLLRASFRF